MVQITHDSIFYIYDGLYGDVKQEIAKQVLQIGFGRFSQNEVS